MNTGEESETSAPRWQPLEAIERRILGALVEKAKTTPDIYPLSLNALKSACNQKNNRYPQMTVEEEQLEDPLDSLRQKGAITAVQGSSRVERYRHHAYEWLGVDKVELAVMTELLLRGAQTVGELRGRAARMEPIKGMSELEPVIDRLIAKKLVLYITPPGRGAVVTHNLYQPRELDKVRREAGEIVAASASAAPDEPAQSSLSAQPGEPKRSIAPLQTTPSSATLPPEPRTNEIAQLRSELTETRSELNDLRTEVEFLRNDLDDLKRQLS